METDSSTPASPKFNPHSHSPDAVLRHFDTQADGLNTGVATDRLLSHGHNRLPAPPVVSPLRRFLRQFNNLLIIVLILAAAITAALGHWLDTAVILAVVIVNTALGFVQEGKAEKAIASIKNMLAPHASVLRDGERHSIPAEELVPGDIVMLEAGDRVPADLRLLRISALFAQEAVLTGESVPVEKSLREVAEDAALGDRRCMSFSGTLITSGQGSGIVVATGLQTELGRISHMLTNVEQLATPLLQQIAVFSRWLTAFILTMAGAILGFGYYVRGMPFDELFVVVVGLSVAAIPEGLPAVLTVTLAIGVQAMARRNAIVRRLPAIETLGSVSVICSDKTGTLTRNEMMVATVARPGKVLTLSGEGYAPEGVFESDSGVHGHETDPALMTLARAAVLCNDAALRLQDGHWTVHGDPMEGALLSFAQKAGLQADDENSKFPRLDLIPFDARHRFMATLNRVDDDSLVFVKGAPEQVVSMCSQQSSVGGETTAFDSGHWQQLAEQIAEQGQRVLALAMKVLPAGQDAIHHEDVESGLVMLGLVGLIDPPRAEAITAIAECHEAGIEVKMITGDHAGTAAAIGRQIGLRLADKVLTGAEIDKLDDAALSAAILQTDIFARTSPEHKLRLVTALQAHGKVVAMTGDGVNDAPALKRADAGIAMGRKGSEAAREASELVLADDNFASIVAAIRAGRTVYDNLRKVISFLLPINGGESLSLIIAILFALTLPITAAQILWVNMVSSVALALALAFEPTEAGVMKRPPRKAGESILSGQIIWRIVFVSLIFTAGVFGQFELAQSQGLELEVARTMAVNTLVVMEIFYLFSVRYAYGSSLTLKGALGTPAVLWSISAVTAFQLLFTYTPWMNLAFGSTPLGVAQGVQVLVFGVLVLLLIELEKWLRRVVLHID
jgi:calcium-translocating P-type ATPase